MAFYELPLNPDGAIVAPADIIGRFQDFVKLKWT